MGLLAMFRSGGGAGVATKRQKITTTVDSAGPLSSISNTEGETRQLHKEGKSTVHMAEAKQ